MLPSLAGPFPSHPERSGDGCTQKRLPAAGSRYFTRNNAYSPETCLTLLCSTAVPFGAQTSQSPSKLSPKRDRITGGPWLIGPIINTKPEYLTIFTNNIKCYLLWSPVIVVPHKRAKRGPSAIVLGHSRHRFGSNQRRTFGAKVLMRHTGGIESTGPGSLSPRGRRKESYSFLANG